MLFDLFTLQLIASFLVGGISIALAITIAERFGSKLGAIILSIPTTAAVSFLFIGITHSTLFVKDIIPSAILGLALFIVFLSSFILFLSRLGMRALLISLLVWVVIGFLIISYPIFELLVSLLFFSVIYLTATFLLPIKKQLPGAKPVRNTSIFLLRVVIAGLTVSAAVFLSKTLGPVWGGLFSMFPASTLSSYYLLLNSSSREFVESVARNMVPNSITLLFYTLAVYFLFPLLGVWTGTGVSWLLSLGFAFVFSKIRGFSS